MKHQTTSTSQRTSVVTDTYTAIIEKAPHNDGAFVPDLPGCLATGDRIEETVRSLREAIRADRRGPRRRMAGVNH
jgi:hypothetical protein